MKATWGRRLGLGLAGTFIVFGVLEISSPRSDSAGAQLFWVGALLGGGALVLAGVLGRWPNPATQLMVILVGVLLGVVGTLWTVVVPVVALAVCVVLIQDFARAESANEVQST